MDPENEEAVGTQNDARLALLNNISDELDTGRADEFFEQDDSGLVSKFVPTTTELPPPLASDDDGVTEKELERMAEEANAEPLVEEPQKIKIKVNGKEIELTQAELIERAQKIEAADTYLREAARIHKEAQHPTPQQPSKVVVEAGRIEKMRARARAIQMGTEEEAIAALMEMESSPSVTADDLARTVDERLTFKKAGERFETDFADVLSDPILRQLAIQKDTDLMARGDTRGYWERYAAIGNELRTWVASKAPTPVAAAPAVGPDKQSRKASVASVPKTASVKSTAPADEDDREESPSEVIAGIAKNRGGPQWMRA